MQKVKHLILYVILALSAVSCVNTDSKVKYEPQPGDTLYTENAAMVVFDRNPERALLILDSAVVVGNLDEDRAKMLRARVLSRSTADLHFEEALQICEALMQSDFVDNPVNRENVLDLLITITRRRGDNEQWVRWSTEKVDLCRQQGDETEALRTEAEIGFILAQLGEEERGLAKLSGVIGALDEQRHFNEMDACIIAIKRKINILDILDRTENIIPLAQRIIDKIDDYRQHSDDYADGSFRLPQTDEQFNGYCNFYTAQAYCFLAKAYAEIGEYDTARHYMSLFEESDYGKTFSGRMMASRTWCILGDYDKMLAIYDVAAARLGNDTMNLDFSSMLYNRAFAAEAAGDYQASTSYWRRYTEIKNVLDRKQHEGQAFHYAARYKLQEERMNTEREQAKAKQNKSLALAGFILVILSVGFIIRLLIQRHAIDRKNRVLTEQMIEAVKYKKEISQKLQTSHFKLQTRAVEELNDEQLFDYLSNVIRREELFLNHSFGRQVLMDRFHINERRIGAAFSCCEGLPDFIRDLRLEYACQLITDNPEMTISEVATASGFSNLTVFGRDFKRKYEVTPTYFRSQMTAKK
ncbi:MAG: AraC family transcriptional regulator [Bacteroidales bacterium]|nr:AraC family transcriptional regulator [Bacteroidales bacterium]